MSLWNFYEVFYHDINSNKYTPLFQRLFCCGKKKNTRIDPPRRASEAAALIRRHRHDDAVTHATADAREDAGAGGAVTGNEAPVVALGGHQVERRVVLYLPLGQDRVAVALCRCRDGRERTRTYGAGEG